jgi:flagellar protein FlgJ
MEIGKLGSPYIDSAGFDISPPGIREGVENAKLRAGAVPFSELLERAGRETPPPAGGAGKALVDKTDKLYEQCEALEVFLVKNLITGMRNTIQKSGLIDEGFAGKMYEDMLYDEYAREFTKGAGFGLAELAYLELTGRRGRVLAEHA